MKSDTELLRDCAAAGDAAGLSVMIRRYQDFVYGTCLRLHRNPVAAQDSAQECFLELIRHADRIESSVGGWLHRCARHVSLKAIERERARDAREQAFAESLASETTAATWQDVEPHVDTAIEELPDELRQVVVEHFLRQRTQVEIAEELGVSAATVSRRIDKGLEELRGNLRKVGVVASVTVLGALLTQNATAAAPAALTTALGKVVLAGMVKGGGATAAAAGTGGTALLVKGLAVGAAVLVLAVGGVVAYHAARRERPPVQVPTPPPSSVTKGATAMVKPDYTKLVLTGDARTQDHFSLAVLAAARLLGREGEYETVYALSTNAFTPAIQPGENCMSWWNLYGRAEALDVVAASLGLAAKKLELPELKLSAADSQEVFAQKTARQQELCPPIMRAAMAAGALILTEGGWKGNGPHGFLAWGWWGIITEARDGGPILGATINGHLDNPLAYVPPCYTLMASATRLSREEADVRMLQLATSRIRGTGNFGPGESVFGLAAMDRWIAQMATVPGFCPGCHQRGKRGWTDAADNALAVAEGAKVVAAYLRRRMTTFPERTRPPLERVAGCYDRIQTLLQPALTGSSGESYQQFIGELAKQQAHAETVLKPVKAELAAAADEMEKALVLLAGPPAGGPASQG